MCCVWDDMWFEGEGMGPRMREDNGGAGAHEEPVSKVPARLSAAKGRDDRRNHIHKCCDIRLADMLFRPYAVVNERAQ